MRILRVGIIGCGEVTQAIHIPNLNNLAQYFTTTFLCDISPSSMKYCAKKVQGNQPQTTTSAAELCASRDVDVVLIANADTYHVEHGLLALKNNKYCLIEKPLAHCYRDIDRLVEAERTSTGKVMVGTMRRYATVFADAVQEIGGMSKIIYARVRDLIGPNSHFVHQSGMFPQKFSDFTQATGEDRRSREAEVYDQAFGAEFHVPQTQDAQSMLRVLGGLGTHDLSAMREIFGMPQGVAGSVLGFPGIFAVIFQYDGFAVTYESGVHQVPEFDAHIEVYSPEKIIRVEFDTPYIKGLPTIMTVKEQVGEGGFQKRVIRKTYTDPYTEELLSLYDCVVNGKSPKTSATDARQDVELFEMILRSGYGTVQ